MGKKSRKRRRSHHADRSYGLSLPKRKRNQPHRSDRHDQSISIGKLAFVMLVCFWILILMILVGVIGDIEFVKNTFCTNGICELSHRLGKTTSI